MHRLRWIGSSLEQTLFFWLMYLQSWVLLGVVCAGLALVVKHYRQRKFGVQSFMTEMALICLVLAVVGVPAFNTVSIYNTAVGEHRAKMAMNATCTDEYQEAISGGKADTTPDCKEARRLADIGIHGIFFEDFRAQFPIGLYTGIPLASFIDGLTDKDPWTLVVWLVIIVGIPLVVLNTIPTRFITRSVNESEGNQLRVEERQENGQRCTYFFFPSGKVEKICRHQPQSEASPPPYRPPEEFNVQFK